MNNLLYLFQETWLPNKLAKRIMAIGLSLAVSTYYFHEKVLEICHIKPTVEILTISKTTVPVVLLFLSFLISHIVILQALNQERTSRHREDIEKLLLAAIAIIDKRHNLTNNLIYDFKDIYEFNKVYLPKHQENILSKISPNLHELMSLSTLLSTEPVGDKRTEYSVFNIK